MDKNVCSGSNFDGGFNRLIFEDDLQQGEHPPHSQSNHTSQGNAWRGKLSFTCFAHQILVGLVTDSV